MSVTAELMGLARDVAPALSDDELAELAAGWLLASETVDWLLAPETASARPPAADFLRRVQRRLEGRREFGQASAVAALVSVAEGGA